MSTARHEDESYKDSRREGDPKPEGRWVPCYSPDYGHGREWLTYEEYPDPPPPEEKKECDQCQDTGVVTHEDGTHSFCDCETGGEARIAQATLDNDGEWVYH